VCRISAANFVELGIVIERQLGVQAGLDCDEFLQRAQIMIEPVTIDHAQRARYAFSRFGKGKHPAGLNFGDCFAYALASATGEPLLFKGNDFAQTDIRPVLNLS
jgi:ribonuclease VapC